MTYREFNNIQENATNFIEYGNISTTVRRVIRTLPITADKYELQDEFQLSTFKLIYKDKNGCKSIYNHLVTNNIKPLCYQKWETELGLDQELNWEGMFTKQIKVTIDSNLRWLQFRLMHRILATNSLLLKMKLSENDKCTFCREEKESLLHLFWECSHTHKFWNDVFNLMTEHGLLSNTDRNMSDIILGKDGESTLVNLIILIAKRYIYSAKISKSVPYVSVFKKSLKLHFKVEQKIAYMTNTVEIFRQKWYLLHNMLDAI